MRLDIGQATALDRLITAAHARLRAGVLRALLRDALERRHEMQLGALVLAEPVKLVKEVRASRVRVMFEENDVPGLAQFFLEKGAVSGRQKTCEIRVLLEWYLSHSIRVTSEVARHEQVANRVAGSALPADALMPVDEVPGPGQVAMEGFAL